VEKRYVLICVDDLSRFTRVRFIREKAGTIEVLKKFCLRLQREKDSVIVLACNFDMLN